MSKVQELIIGLSFFLLSILIGGLYSSYVAQANSLTEVAMKQTTVVSNTNVDYSLIKINEEVRDFSLQDQLGQIRSFRELRNNKYTLVYFFAGGCGHCLQMLPKLQENKLLYRAKELSYQVIGISFYGRPQQDKVIAEKFGLPSPILADPQGTVCRSFGVGEFTIALINADNILYYREMMNGSNWPSDKLEENALKLNYLKAISSELPTTGDQKQNNTLDINQTLPNDATNPEVSIFSLTHNFTYTPLSKYPSLQKVYTFLYPIFLLGIFLFTIVALTTTKNSWLPILAMSQVLLIATFYDCWLFFPTNLVLLGILLYIYTKQNFVLVATIFLSSIISFYILSLTNLSDFATKHFDQAFLQIIWHLLPAGIFSLIMVQIALSNQTQPYTKFAYPVANKKDVEEGFQAASTIAIRTVSKAERCDVCHKADQFNLETGYCQRCQTTTK